MTTKKKKSSRNWFIHTLAVAEELITRRSRALGCRSPRAFARQISSHLKSNVAVALSENELQLAIDALAEQATNNARLESLIHHLRWVKEGVAREERATRRNRKTAA